jgi:hypothetical protein
MKIYSKTIEAMKKLLVLATLALTLASEHAFAQINYFEDTFIGGVTAAGYSPTYNAGGTGAFALNIAAGSTVRKAFLIAGRHGNAPNCTVTMNGINYTFNSSNLASTVFQSPAYGGNSGVHIIEVTSDIDATVNNYSLTVPAQAGPSNRYNDFVLYVAYDNNSLSTVHTAIFINNHDFSDDFTYTLNLNTAINTATPVAVSLMTGYVCDNSGDGQEVRVGNYNMGTIGSPDAGSGTCGGPLGSFAYSNGALTGLNDDANNLAVSVADALSDVKTKVTNGGTSFNLRFSTSTNNNNTNAIWGVFYTNGSNSPLPVQLTEFTGVADKEVNHIGWTTVTEINCSYFEVERSNDGSNFTSLGTVQGAGNSTLTNHYTFTDETPFLGANYYRLKQMDYDGQYRYSNEISITNNNYLTLAVDVYTLQGQKITSLKNVYDNYSLQNLMPGVYLFYYHTTKGIVVKKVMCRPEQELVVMK